MKQTKELFLPSLTPRSRSEFFATDVIFLGDVPAEVLTRAFCERLEEFVGTFGGGLVVMAGPRFGPGRLAQATGNPDLDAAVQKLRNMLPVEVDPRLKVKEGRFAMQITPLGRQTEFMRLADGENSASAGWERLGQLPWYQPVARPHKLVQVLAVHPTDLCGDGTAGGQPQPLIATRQYGKGQVVYLGFNETWRLRRKYGEQYYRQFWGQLIHHLGFSHALGGDKRFVARIDNDQGRYQAGDKSSSPSRHLTTSTNRSPRKNSARSPPSCCGPTPPASSTKATPARNSTSRCCGRACSRRGSRCSPRAITGCW